MCATPLHLTLLILHSSPPYTPPTLHSSHLTLLPPYTPPTLHSSHLTLLPIMHSSYTSSPSYTPPPYTPLHLTPPPHFTLLPLTLLPTLYLCSRTCSLQQLERGLPLSYEDSLPLAEALNTFAVLFSLYLSTLHDNEFHGTVPGMV